MPIIDPAKRQFMLIVLELTLRRKNGDAFQDFFARVMSKAHPSDYIRVRPFGRRGDKGSDGYLRSTGEVFACYGALNSEGSRVDYLISKMGEDFAKARNHLSDLMNRWTMVHNFVDGLPVEAAQKLRALERENPDLQFGFFGREKFEKLLLELDEDAVQSLLGAIAGSHEVNNLQTEDVKLLIDAVSKDIQSHRGSAGQFRPVPLNKVDFNEIMGAWHSLLLVGFQNTRIVASYLERHPNPMLAEDLAMWFGGRYEALKQQHLSPSGILTALYETLAGRGSVVPERQVAAQAILAYFFERCDIFEDTPVRGVG